MRKRGCRCDRSWRTVGLWWFVVVTYTRTHLWKDPRENGRRDGTGDQVDRDMGRLLLSPLSSFGSWCHISIIKEIINSSEATRSKIDPGVSNLRRAGQGWGHPAEHGESERPERPNPQLSPPRCVRRGSSCGERSCTCRHIS